VKFRWFTSYWRKVWLFIYLLVRLELRHTGGLIDLKSAIKAKHLDKLHRLTEAKYHLRNWLLKFFVLPSLTIAMIVVYVSVTRPVASTAIAISVWVSDVSFLSSNESSLRDIDLSNKSDNGPYGLTRLTSDSISGRAMQWSFIEHASSSVHLNALQIPAGSQISLANRVTGELILNVSGSAGSAVKGALKVSNSTLIVETDVHLDSLDIVSRDLKFEKKLGYEEFEIDLTGISDLDFPSMRVQNVDFVERSPTKEFVDTSVKGGVIRLLETSSDSIIIRNHDKLSVQFEGDANIKVSKTAAGFLVYVEGIATELLCGAELIESSPRFNRMPIRIAMSYEKYPYFWLIGIAILPLLVGLFWPKQIRS